MIHYHVAPVSGGVGEQERFFAGRHALVSHCYKRVMPEVAASCSTFILDNGAYTYWTKGGDVSYEGYLEWVCRWMRHPKFDWAIVPDKIGGTEKENDSLLRLWPREIPGAAVWHVGESIERLKRLRAWALLRRATIAIGGSPEYKVGSQMWWKKVGEAMCVLTDSVGRPVVRLHGLRMLNPKVFTELPLRSADSATAARNAGSVGRFGAYPPSRASERGSVIADRIESHSAAATWEGRMQLSLMSSGDGLSGDGLSGDCGDVDVTKGSDTSDQSGEAAMRPGNALLARMQQMSERTTDGWGKALAEQAAREAEEWRRQEEGRISSEWSGDLTRATARRARASLEVRQLCLRVKMSGAWDKMPQRREWLQGSGDVWKGNIRSLLKPVQVTSKEERWDALLQNWSGKETRKGRPTRGAKGADRRSTA